MGVRSGLYDTEQAVQCTASRLVYSGVVKSHEIIFLLIDCYLIYQCEPDYPVCAVNRSRSQTFMSACYVELENCLQHSNYVFSKNGICIGKYYSILVHFIPWFIYSII